MSGLKGWVDMVMPILRTWSAVGERRSRMESMKVTVPGAVGTVRGSIVGVSGDAGEVVLCDVVGVEGEWVRDS